MKQVTVRMGLPVSEQMHEYLLDEAPCRELSFEGLLLSSIEAREALPHEKRHSRS